jgi:hypothetical protein
MSGLFSARTRTIWGVVAMTVLLAIYLGLTVNLAVALVMTGDPIAVTIGVALFVFPVVGAWALVRELMFGIRSAQLTRILADEGNLPVDELPHLPSGRTVRDAADAAFGAYASEVEAEPESWRAWFRLGLAYDACGDRRRARGAIRRAIALHRA